MTPFLTVPFHIALTNTGSCEEAWLFETLAFRKVVGNFINCFSEHHLPGIFMLGLQYDRCTVVLTNHQQHLAVPT